MLKQQTIGTPLPDNMKMNAPCTMNVYSVKQPLRWKHVQPST